MSPRGLPLVLALLAATPATAVAGDNDLVLSRLATVVDENGTPVNVIGQNRDFRSMVSELGVVLAPRLLAPSDTLGFGGFQFSADVGWTSITSDARYWRVLESSDDPTGSGSHGASLLPTVGLFARKGLWFPVPSVEVAVGAIHLLDSRTWAPQAYAKFALVEGYHDLPIPSVAVRGAVSRLMGSRQLDLTVASLDASLSKHLGIGGTWSIDPYGGYNLLVIVPRSEVIDASPGIDPLMPGNEDDRDLNFVFKDQDDILRHRFFVGAKMQYYVFALTLEASFALAGSSVDDRAGDMECMASSPTTQCDATDQAGAQRTITAAIGLDF